MTTAAKATRATEKVSVEPPSVSADTGTDD